MSDTATITLDTTIKRAELIVSSELVDETVMMNVEKGVYYGLDDIETKLWQIIETPTSVSVLCDSLLSNYDVAREQGETDVLTFLNELHAEGIIEVVEAG